MRKKIGDGLNANEEKSVPDGDMQRKKEE